MSPAARLNDVIGIGIGVSIGASGASENGGMVFIGMFVAVVFLVARAIEDHYLKQIERVRKS